MGSPILLKVVSENRFSGKTYFIQLVPEDVSELRGVDAAAAVLVELAEGLVVLADVAGGDTHPRKGISIGLLVSCQSGCWQTTPEI